MRTLRRTRTSGSAAVAMVATVVMIAIIAFSSGCGTENSTQQSQAVSKATPANPGDSLEQTKRLYRTAADSLVTRYAGALKSAVGEAAAESGMLGAIGVCQHLAPKISADYSIGGWSIKRVSDRYRNPNNRADTTEVRFLMEFADTSELAPNFLVDWHPADSGSTAEMQFAYYKPIRIQPMCLKCHGDMQTLAPGVYEALKKDYPLDKATGYRPGDLRGMFVVQADFPAATETAQLLASGEFQPVAEDSVVTEETPESH